MTRFSMPLGARLWHYAAELGTLSVTYPLHGSALNNTTDNPSNPTKTYRLLPDFVPLILQGPLIIWSEWRLTVIAATVRIALVDILDLSEVDIPAGGFLYPAVGWG